MIGVVVVTHGQLATELLNAAETIASRAMGADPLPKRPLEIACDLKTNTLRRLDYSTVEASHRVDFDGEYIVHFSFPGARAADRIRGRELRPLKFSHAALLLRVTGAAPLEIAVRHDLVGCRGIDGAAARVGT